MEVASGEHGCVQTTLAAAVTNSPILKAGVINNDGPINNSVNIPNGICNSVKRTSVISPMSPTTLFLQSNDSLSPAVPDVTPSTLFQFTILLKRTLLSTSRDQTLTQLRIVSHVLVGLLIGMLYYKIGDEASNVSNNAGCLFFTVLFLMFSSMMPTILTFPMEMAVFIREHLNHWYSLKSFYLAKTSADIPFQVVFTVVYVCIVYWMTNQPRDMNRFSMFLIITILTALVAQSVGLLVGAAMSVENGTYFGPVTAIPCVLFSGFFVTLNAIPSYLQWLSYLSYIRFGYEGCMLAVYGFNRARLKCSEPYCHFRNPEKYLEELDMADTLFWVDVVVLIIFFVVLRIVTYVVLRWKIHSWT